MVDFDEEKQKLKLAELRRKEEEEFVRDAAANRGLQYFNLSAVPIDADALKLIPEVEAREAQLVGFQLLDKKLGVAVVNPDNEKVKTILQGLATLGYSVSLFLVSPESLERALEKYKEVSLTKETKTGSFDISSEEIGDRKSTRLNSSH